MHQHCFAHTLDCLSVISMCVYIQSRTSHVRSRPRMAQLRPVFLRPCVTYNPDKHSVSPPIWHLVWILLENNTRRHYFVTVLETVERTLNLTLCVMFYLGFISNSLKLHNWWTAKLNNTFHMHIIGDAFIFTEKDCHPKRLTDS